MPRLKRLRRRTKTRYTEYHYHQLLCGHSSSGDAFGRNTLNTRVDVAAMGIAWKELRGDLLPEWIEDNPGTRPYAWWMFDAPERRRCVNGEHPYDSEDYVAEIKRLAADPNTHENFIEAARGLTYGIPRMDWGDEDFDAQYESESEYLQRLGLFTPEETSMVERGDLFAPQADAEQSVSYRPLDRYCGDRLREYCSIPRGKLLD